MTNAGGAGLFGTMLADKLARPLADQLVAKVNAILEARDEEEARMLQLIQSGGGACALQLPLLWLD